MSKTKAVLVLLVAFFLVLPAIHKIRWGSRTDDELIARMDAALETGSLIKQYEALDAISELLRRGNPKVKEPEVVDCLLTSGALLLADDGKWTVPGEARYIYDTTRLYDHGTVIEGLVRKVMNDERNRLHVLFFAVKLGLPGTEDRLNEVLHRHGDKNMAEDFLNSGSPKLCEGGRNWANSHGYSIGQGMGSHRVSWGRF